MKKEITLSVRQARDYKNVLDENAEKILRGGLFRRVTLQEKLSFLKELASARTSLWANVYRDFPEAKDFSSVVITNEHIECENNLSTPTNSEENKEK